MAVDLGKQVGPLPLGAWIAVVGVGGGIALWARSKGDPASAPDAPEFVDDTAGDVGVGDGSVGGWTQTQPTPTTTGDVGGVAADNIAWTARAVTWLIAQGYDPALSNNAVNKALAQGELGKMSIREFALWSVALLHFGPPPEPVIVLPPTSTPPPVTPKPPPKTGGNAHAPKRVGGHWYVVKQGDSLHEIARQKYHAGFMWVMIFNANRQGKKRPDGSRGKMSNPKDLHKGDRLYVP